MASGVRALQGAEAAPRVGIIGLDAAWGITAVRVAMGVILIVAGFQKVSNLNGVIGFFGTIGIPLPMVLGPAISLLELIGGVLLLIGLRASWVAVLFVVEFLVAFLYVKLGHGAGWDNARIDLMMLAGAVLLVLAGPGNAAVDALWRRREP